MKRDDLFWKDLARASWTRKKWRKPRAGAGAELCHACRLPLHREGTYYLRPAYWDGIRWLCQSCYERMMQAAGRPVSKRYGRSSPGDPETS